MPRQEPTSTDSTVNELNTQVPNTSLQAVLQQLEEQKKEIALLRSLQDKTKLLSADQNFSNDKRRLYRYRLLDGKAIKSWDNMVVNDVRIIQGDIVENQIVRITFSDDTTKEYTYKAYNDGYALSEYCRAKAHSTTDEGVFITLETPDGDLTIKDTYLN